MKGLPALLFCIMLAAAPVACGQDKGKTTTQKKATTHAQSKTPTQGKTSTKAQKKAPTQAQKAQQDRMRACSQQANARNLKGEERRKFTSSCGG
jgi:uncharacterized protein HemX